MRPVVLVLLGAAAIGCANNPARPGTVPLGAPFDLRAGASTLVEGGLTITFTAVTSDSRCPMDAVCVWAGDAIVSLSLSQQGSDRANRDVHTAINAGEASYMGYSVKLIALAPYPRSALVIRPDEYVATFEVRKR